MKKHLKELLTITILITVILSANVFAFRPISHPPTVGDDKSLSIGADSRLPVSTVTASGLSTTTFDTLVGTVTVNLPDDLAAGDTISGTVIAEGKNAPEDKAKGQSPRDLDELSGYVVEVAEQQTPMKKPEGNQIDFCKAPASNTNDYSLTVCNKWSIPEGVAKIPVVLKDKAGKILARADVPVGPMGNIAKAETPSGTSQYPPKYFTPAVGQAGKPISITGPFDGDFGSTKVKIGDQTMAKFLASSPRKMVVESPRDLKGVNDIAVEYKGKTVANCTYRSVSIRLAADKLNLMKGEQTNLTVNVAGLIGLLSPVSVQLTNKSPETVGMDGGDSQAIIISPRDVNGDNFTTKRTLTGVKAGGFSITAVVDPSKSDQADCGGGAPRDLPITPVPEPSPGNPTGQPTGRPSPIDADGNPRTNDGPGRPVSPMRARYRVTLNGFTVNRVTNHGLLQRPDAVTFNPNIGRVNADGSRPSNILSGDTNSIGMTPENAVLGGSSSPNGGLQTRDGFPTQTTPWLRTLPRSSAPLTIPPTIYFEGEIIQNTNAAWIIPNIWSVDGRSDLDLEGAYESQLRRDLDALARNVGRIIRGPQPLELASYLKPGNTMGLNNTISLAMGVMQDRPVGMQPIGGNRFGFTPQVLVLTFESAEFMSRTSFGFGRGIVPVRYVDTNEFGADYTLYFQVERTDTLPPCAESLTGASATGMAVLETDNSRARGPYRSAIDLTVSFTECRGTVRITNFTPVVTDPYPIELPNGTVLQNRTTVTLTGGGTGTRDLSTGRITIPVTLHFAHSVEADLGPLALPSDLTLTLTTEGSGGQRLSNGSFVLVGSGQFARGFLGNSNGNLTVTGAFSPRP